MKSKFKKISITLVLLCLFCVLTACSSTPEKAILGKWYNEDGDCLEILSDNTYSINQVSKYSYDIGLDSGEWEYLKEEGFFKFYANTYDGDVIKVEINADTNGTCIKYTYYGTFYKK